MDIRDRKDITTLEKIRLVVDEMVPRIGFEKMTIRDICREVGITVGTFYHYFESKDDLMFDRHIRTQKYFLDLYTTELKDMNEIEGLKLFIKKYIKYNKSRVYPVFREFHQLLMKNSKEWNSKYPSTIKSILLSIIESGQEKNIITNKYKASEIVQYISILCSGITYEYLSSNQSILDNTALEELICEAIESFRK